MSIALWLAPACWALLEDLGLEFGFAMSALCCF
jgi:hypothetical protein